MAQGRRADPHDRHGRRHHAGQAARLREAPRRRRAWPGSGSGSGSATTRRPRSLIDRRRPRTDFPLFEVPYPVPFIAITEAVFTRIVAEQYDTLQRAVDAEHVLTRAVMEGKGPRGHRAVARRRHEGVGVAARPPRPADRQHQPRGLAPRRARLGRAARHAAPRARSFSLTLVDRGHHIWVQPVGAQGRVEAFLAVGKPEQLSQLDRIVAGHALSLFAIELAKSRAVADAQRRLQGDFFDELARGGARRTPTPVAGSRASGSTATPRCSSCPSKRSVRRPIRRRWRCAVTDERSRAGGGFLASAHDDGVHLLLPAEPEVDLAAGHEGDRPIAWAPSCVPGPAPPSTADEVGRSLREVEVRAPGVPPGGLVARRVRRPGHVPAAAVDDRARRAAGVRRFDARAARRVRPGPQRGAARARSRRSSSTTPAGRRRPRELFVHRHTLRYRMRKVEELTGRDLSSSFDRMEFWLALRARDLQAAQQEAVTALSTSDNRRGAARAIRRVDRSRHREAYWRSDRAFRRSSRLLRRGGEHGRQPSDVHQRRVGELVRRRHPRHHQPSHGRGDRRRAGRHRRGRRHRPSPQPRRPSTTPGSTPRPRIAS